MALEATISTGINIGELKIDAKTSQTQSNTARTFSDSEVVYVDAKGNLAAGGDVFQGDVTIGDEVFARLNFPLNLKPDSPVAPTRFGRSLTFVSLRADKYQYTDDCGKKQAGIRLYGVGFDASEPPIVTNKKIDIYNEFCAVALEYQALRVAKPLVQVLVNRRLFEKTNEVVEVYFAYGVEEKETVLAVRPVAPPPAGPAVDDPPVETDPEGTGEDGGGGF